MLRSYFLIAFRSLVKQKIFSFVKLAGLAFGLATCIVIYLYVQEDLSFDRFHQEHNQIVRVLTIDKAEGVSSKIVAVTAPALGPAAKEELPEVVESVRLTGGGNPYDLVYEDQAVKSSGAFRVDPSFLNVFSFEVLKGPKSGLLNKPGSIVITETLAGKIFGTNDPIGKTLKLNGEFDLNITAVIADPPKNSHLQFDLLHSLVPGQNEDGLRDGLDSWDNIFCNTYLLLNRKPDLADLENKLQAINKKNNETTFFIPTAQLITDIHLHSKEILFDSSKNKSDILNVYVLSSIAILILILAVVNFMNLATANATTRAKEMGMRKVIGAVRSQLIYQHLMESLILTLIAGLFSLLLIDTLLPLLNNLYQRNADFNILMETENLCFLGGLIIMVALLAGLYPSFILSSYKPMHVLKGSFKSSIQGIHLRKGLVILQFTISIALMIGTGIVYQQMEFIQNADLGYSRDQVITLQQNRNTVQNSVTLKNELLTNTSITSVGTSSTRMGQQLGRTRIFPEGHNSDGTNIITSIMAMDDTYIPTMDMKIIAGRNFDQAGDSLSMIVNEEMVSLLKWENDVIGKTISLERGPGPDDRTPFKVIGVVKNFHFATVRHKLEPLFIVYNPGNNSMAIRVKAENIENTIHSIEDSWKKLNPASTFEYAFLDEQFANLYRNEQAFSAMFSLFTVLAILIAAIGLFALSAFTAEQRKKEIGIRKVLGASNVKIFYQLSSEYIILILIAFPLASAGSYYIMKQWLQDFQYSITISVEVFIMAGLIAVGISILTISYQAVKAAISNPVNSLRSE